MKDDFEKFLDMLVGKVPEKKNRGWYPQDQIYYDVNHSFRNILCELLHGEHSVLVKFPVREAGKKELQYDAYDQTVIFLEETRNGMVVRFALPRTFCYTNPLSRVLQHPGRRANPFLHLYEAMWMLAGSNDVTQLTPFAKQMAQYSDDGKTMHGAYGHRWRTHFGGDQLEAIINELRENPSSRRLNLQMWDPQADLIGFEYKSGKYLTPPGGEGPVPLTYGVEFSKDLPCNTNCYFQTRIVETTEDVTEVQLDLTVMNRSNDIVWGMLGSNYVTFSFLLEYVALMTGLKVGRYNHFTANAHIYLDKYPKAVLEEWHGHHADHSVFSPRDEMVPLVTAPENFDNEVKLFVQDPYYPRYYDNQFFNQVAVPMMATHKHLKDKELGLALHQADLIGQADWAAGAKMFVSTSKFAKKTTSFPNN